MKSDKPTVHTAEFFFLNFLQSKAQWWFVKSQATALNAKYQRVVLTDIFVCTLFQYLVQ